MQKRELNTQKRRISIVKKRKICDSMLYLHRALSPYVTQLSSSTVTDSRNGSSRCCTLYLWCHSSGGDVFTAMASALNPEETAWGVCVRGRGLSLTLLYSLYASFKIHLLTLRFILLVSVFAPTKKERNAFNLLWGIVAVSCCGSEQMWTAVMEPSGRCYFFLSLCEGIVNTVFAATSVVHTYSGS